MKEKNLKINAVLNLIKTISSIIFPLITFPYVSRVLMPGNIGKINFASSFVSYFTLIASLGITTYAIRECSARRENKEDLSKTASQIFSINVYTTIVAYILMAFTLLFFKEFDEYSTLIIIQSTAILFTTLGCDWLNTAMEDFSFITIRTIAFQIISLILMFSFVHNPNDYIKYAAITVLSSSGANIVNVVYRKKYCDVKFVRQIAFKKHFKPIMLLFVMILAQTIFNSSDITMLGLMKGDYEVGLYSSAVKMSNLVSQVVASLVWVVMPRMSLYFAEENYKKINEMLKKTFNLLITIGLPCAVGCICLSKETVLIIAGNQYIDAAPILVILIIGFVFSLAGGSFLGNMVLLPSKREGDYMLICSIATVVNLIMNYFMIPVYGVNAAAGTTAFSSFLIMVLLIIFKDKRIKIDYIGKCMYAPTIGCILIVVLCLAIKFIVGGVVLQTALCFFGSVVAYLIVQVVLKNEMVSEMTSLLAKKLRRK